MYLEFNISIKMPFQHFHVNLIQCYMYLMVYILLKANYNLDLKSISARLFALHNFFSALLLKIYNVTL